MSKQIDAGLRAHLAGETLTLAACWEIERVDGRKFFFTDHDRSLTVNGDTYRPSSGFTRSAVKVTGDLRPRACRWWASSTTPTSRTRT